MRSAQGGDARAFRIPLVPANLDANFSVFRIEIREPEITWREIKLFVVERVVGDMHFAVFAEEAAVRVEDRAGVVVDAGGTAFEERDDEDDFVFFRDSGERFRSWAGDRFGEVEQCRVLFAAKIFAAEKFLKRDDLRAARGGFTDFIDRARKIFVGVRGATHLHQADCKFVCHRNLV